MALVKIWLLKPDIPDPVLISFKNKHQIYVEISDKSSNAKKINYLNLLNKYLDNNEMKIMFSIHMGDSIAHVVRTRGLVHRLETLGHHVTYVVDSRAAPFMSKYVSSEHVIYVDQTYGFSRLEPWGTLKEKFTEHVRNEYEIFKRVAPDIIVGDMGLIATTYAINTPIIKILNRFFLELTAHAQSTFDMTQKYFIRGQIEDLINSGRKAIGIRTQFTYDEFLSGPIIVNGATNFVGIKPTNSQLAGIRIEMSIPSTMDKKSDVAFVSLGTGTAAGKEETARSLLLIAVKHFRKIYLSTGQLEGNWDQFDVNVVVMKKTFQEVPSDVGCIICHGGYGAIHLGMRLGVPVVVVPFQIEHFANGRRLEKLGYGRSFGQLGAGKFMGLEERIQIDWDSFDDYLPVAVKTRNNPFLSRSELADDVRMLECLLQHLDAHRTDQVETDGVCFDG